MDNKTKSIEFNSNNNVESLDTIDDTLKLAGLTWQDIDINHLDLADKEVYNNVYKTGNTIGVFQMESAEARKMCIDAQADNIEDIIVVNAANRPGTKDSFPTYCKNKLSPETAEAIHDDLRPIFQRTQGILLYQEQALQIFRYAGFPEEEVDNARRCIDEHSLVLMSDGSYKEIKDIEIGAMVQCENGLKTFNRPVINKFDNGIQDCYQIVLNDGYKLTATSTHRIMKVEITNSNNYVFLWTQIGDLKESDCVLILDNETEKFAYDAIKVIEYIGERHVYDLEIEEYHNYIADGFLVHNCIGKKQKDKMAKLGSKFREGLTNKEWTKEQQDEIWNLMLKQASYSFNAGHKRFCVPCYGDIV